MITFGCGAFAVCAEDVRRLAAIEEQDDGKPIVIEWARSEVQTPLLELHSTQADPIHHACRPV